MWYCMEVNDISEECTATIFMAKDMLSKQEVSSKPSELRVENMVRYRSV
jgi:hypothetical protein